MNGRPTVLSFFSGAMGLDLGLEQAGFDTRLVCEVDPCSRQTIMVNRPGLPLIGNILDHDATSVRRAAGMSEDEEIDLVVGGPPCQAFSTAGHRKGFEDSRGNLLLTYVDMIRALRPRYAVIENVRGLLSAPLVHRPHAERGEGHAPLSADELPGGALLHVLNGLQDAGYGVSFNLYNAANFGVPQKRERLIIVASRSGATMPYLSPTHSEHGSDGLKPWATLRQALHGLDTEGQHHLEFPEKRLRYYRMLSEGQNWRHLPMQVQKEAMGGAFDSAGGRSGFYRRLAWDQPSPTLVTHPAMPATDLCHPDRLRPLSIEEYKRIQQFPDHWKVMGRITDQYRQIGNAVPVGLGKAIGLMIMSVMKGNGKAVSDLGNFSRYRNTDLDSWRSQVLDRRRPLKASIV